MTTSQLTPFERLALASLLTQSYDTGVVFARCRDDRQLLKKAAALGFVDATGVLTPAGLAFRDSSEYQQPHRGTP